LEIAKALGGRVSQDVKARLIERGLIREGLGGLVLTPQGHTPLGMAR